MHSRHDRRIQTEQVFTLAKTGAKPNSFEIILLQTTRKKNIWKNKEKLARAVITLETERIKRVQFFMLMMMMMCFYCYVYVFLLLHMFCSVYCVFIVPADTLLLIWLRFSLRFPQLQGKCQGITRKDGTRPKLFPINLTPLGSNPRKLSNQSC
jgi:hypothetical protein